MANNTYVPTYIRTYAGEDRDRQLQQLLGKPVSDEEDCCQCCQSPSSKVQSSQVKSSERARDIQYTQYPNTHAYTRHGADVLSPASELILSQSLAPPRRRRRRGTATSAAAAAGCGVCVVVAISIHPSVRRSVGPSVGRSAVRLMFLLDDSVRSSSLSISAHIFFSPPRK